MTCSDWFCLSHSTSSILALHHIRQPGTRQSERGTFSDAGVYACSCLCMRSCSGIVAGSGIYRQSCWLHWTACICHLHGVRRRYRSRWERQSVGRKHHRYIPSHSTMSFADHTFTAIPPTLVGIPSSSATSNASFRESSSNYVSQPSQPTETQYSFYNFMLEGYTRHT